MKLIHFCTFVLRCAVALVIIAWKLLLLFIELLDGGEPVDNDEGLGHHMTVDGRSHSIKRAGEHYLSDRDVALHERENRF